MLVAALHLLPVRLQLLHHALSWCVVGLQQERRSDAEDGAYGKGGQEIDGVLTRHGFLSLFCWRTAGRRSLIRGESPVSGTDVRVRAAAVRTADADTPPHHADLAHPRCRLVFRRDRQSRGGAQPVSSRVSLSSPISGASPTTRVTGMVKAIPVAGFSRSPQISRSRFRTPSTFSSSRMTLKIVWF